MFNVGGAEMLVILVVALIVLGPNRLPDAARQAGKWLGEFRKVSTGFQREMRDAMREISEPFDVTPTSSGSPANGVNGTNGSTTSRPSLDKGPSLDKPAEGASPSRPAASEPTADES